MVSLKNIPFMSIPTIAIFLLEVRGYSKLYDSSQKTYSKAYLLSNWSLLSFSFRPRDLVDLMQFVKEFAGFLFFTDMMIYFIHRGLHHKSVYKHFHKLHHRWIVPTPFASHAFQWEDGFLQSCPYHIYAFLFPMHKLAYLFFFLFVNFWTVSIHDGNYSVPKMFRPIINGAAHHNDHHQYYDCNYGQFFTLWDRLMGSFRLPPIYDETKQNKVDQEISSKTKWTFNMTMNYHFNSSIKQRIQHIISILIIQFSLFNRKIKMIIIIENDIFLIVYLFRSCVDQREREKYQTKSRNLHLDLKTVQCL